MSDIHNEISGLIKALITGGIEASDFRLEISQFSQTMVKNLFRDSIPRFTSTHKEKFTDIFIRNFFNDRKIKVNDLWKFVGYKDFWIEIRKLHDIGYERSMNFNEIMKYFERNLYSRNAKINLNYLEQRIVDRLADNPSILYKEVADEMNVSEKRVSTIIKNLRSKGIYIGSLVNYPSLSCSEFFTFDFKAASSENVIFADEFLLFPKLKLYHGVCSRRNNSSSFYNIQKKKIICNPIAFYKSITIQDWQNHHPSEVSLKGNLHDCTDFSDSVISTNKDYILHLMKNCENDYKKPEIQKIAQIHNISERTLFRTKSKLKERKIIQPKLVIENNDLFNIVIISSQELVELYNKVPNIRSFEIQDYEFNTLWVSFLSIFATDFKFLYSEINKNTEIYQVINKKVIKFLGNNNIQVLPFKT
ncbi:MAG: winged helix-turn-helix domain-containing protein [Candidatus Heimdallarchaeota archaeon]